MSVQRSAEKRTWLSRTELQLELGRLALWLMRSIERVGTHKRGRRWRARTIIDSFLEAGLALLQRTQPAHRPYAIERLAGLAETFELEIIGLENWLFEQVASWRRSCDRLPLRGAATGQHAAIRLT